MADVAQPVESEIWTPEDVAAYLRVTVWHVRHLARNNKIPARRVGSLWRFNREEILNWMQGGKGTR